MQPWRLDRLDTHLQDSNLVWAWNFSETFESTVWSERAKIRMKYLGRFPSAEDEDTFFWMRAFPETKSDTILSSVIPTSGAVLHDSPCERSNQIPTYL